MAWLFKLEQTASLRKRTVPYERGPALHGASREYRVVTDWMMRLGTFWSWRRRVAVPMEPPSTIFAFDRSTPPVPREYLSLYTYLEHRYATIVVLTFEQMEALLGFALPMPAYTESDWWTGAAALTQGYSSAWIGAGRTATPNILAKTVTFVRA